VNDWLILPGWLDKISSPVIKFKLFFGQQSFLGNYPGLIFVLDYGLVQKWEYETIRMAICSPFPLTTGS
jgi:hypothetical protein